MGMGGVSTRPPALRAPRSGDAVRLLSSDRHLAAVSVFRSAAAGGPLGAYAGTQAMAGVAARHRRLRAVARILQHGALLGALHAGLTLAYCRGHSHALVSPGDRPVGRSGLCR